jgi:phosphoglucomutase
VLSRNAMASFTVETVTTTPFPDQKPGTSGLRKRVKVFQQPHYTENFVAAILAVVPDANGAGEKHTLVLGGDGRYFLGEAISKIIRLSAASGKVACWPASQYFFLFFFTFSFFFSRGIKRQ